MLFRSERSSPITEIASFEIPIGIVDRVMDNRYAGDGTVFILKNCVDYLRLQVSQEN